MTTDLPKREAEIAPFSIHNSTICLDNMAGIGYLNSKGNFFTIDNPSNRPLDVYYISFSSNIDAHLVNKRKSDIVLVFE